MIDSKSGIRILKPVISPHLKWYVFNEKLAKKENQNYEKKPSKDRKIEAYLCMSRFS